MIRTLLASVALTLGMTVLATAPTPAVAAPAGTHASHHPHAGAAKKAAVGKKASPAKKKIGKKAKAAKKKLKKAKKAH